MWLFSFLKSGAVSLATNEGVALHVKVNNKHVDFNVMNQKLLTDLLKTIHGKAPPFSTKLKALQSLAQALKKEGVTWTISLKDSLLLTLGSEANPTLSLVFTGTDAIEINSLNRLTQLLSHIVD